VRSPDGRAFQYLIFELGYKLEDNIRNLTKTQISFLLVANPNYKDIVGNVATMTKEEFARMLGTNIAKH
jgi:hypothetical protein